MTLPYHSALADQAPLAAPNPAGIVTSRIRAFCWDLAKADRLPAEYAACDVIYGEPPFDAKGADAFRERAGEEPAGMAFLRPLEAVDAPMVLIGGVPLLKAWKGAPPDDRIRIRLDGSGLKGQGVQMSAFAWRLELPEVKTTSQLIHWLAQTYDCIGDPFCGYGRTARLAFGNAKVVLSDLNASCIGYIAENAKAWEGDW